MVVHEFGQPAKLDRLMEIARKYKLAVIEDAACALGAKYCGKNVGTFGALGCFSLHPRKAITSGEGGIVITEDDKLALKIRALRNHGIVYEKGNVNFLYAGLNYRITDFQSALVLDQMKHLDQLNKLREKQVQRYINANSYITVPAIFSERESSWQSFHLLISHKFDRGKVIGQLKEEGIETNYGAYALNILNYYSNKYKYSREDCPNSVYAHKRGLVLPLGKHVSNKEIDYVIEKVNNLIC